MIYNAYELTRLSTRPVANILELGKTFARHDLNPFRNSYFHRAFATACELPLRALKDYPKQRFDVRGTCRGEEVVLEERVVDRLPFADLIGFSVEDAKERPKVLIAAALSGHHATLLRDTVRGFARDFNPYITDWKDARQVPIEAGDFGFDDYVEYLIHFMRTLGPGTHLVATCQAAPPALIAAAVLARDAPELVPASLTLMAGPIDTRINPNILNKITRKVSLSVLRASNIHPVPPGYPGSGRKVYPGFYQLSGFILVNPKPHLRKYVDFIKDSVGGRDEELEQFRYFYDEYFAVLDMTESFYLESLEKVFFEHHIPTGKITYRGEAVDFSAIDDMPLLTVEAENDNLCPVGQTEAAHAVCSKIPEAKRRHFVQKGVGHYGVFSGSRFQNEIYPAIRDFVNAFHADKNARRS